MDLPLALVAFPLAAAVVVAACSTNMNGLGDVDGGARDGRAGADATLVSSCRVTGGGCASPGDCCSGLCQSGTCAAQPGCASNGAACSGPAGCCSGRCAAGACADAVPGQCQAPGTACTANDTCCSGRCAPVTGMAGVVQCTSFCFADGAPCEKALDCCSLGCFGGRCGGGLCKVESESCAADAECCSDICTAGQCQIDRANRDCRPTGETCTSGSGRGCCTDTCDETVDPRRCGFGSETCRAQGVRCTGDAQCCRGVCDTTTRLCRTTCIATGTACSANNDCCTSSCVGGVCAPPGGSCQPVSGSCTNNTQCCSGFCFGGFCDRPFIIM
jgi:hypothetical protein